MAPDDPPLHAWLRERLGEDPAWRRVTTARTDGGHAVWQVTGAAGAGVIVKRSAGARAFAQEHHAYAAWAPHLAEETAALLAAFPATRTLVLSVAAGAALGAASEAAASEAHWRAGRFLRRLHAIAEADGDPLALAEAVARRFAAWLGRVERRLAAEELRRLRALAAEIPGRFASATRAPCHRDFDAHNWLCRGPIAGGVRTRVTALVVVDFEHARLDDPVADFAKLTATLRPEHRAREEALLAGYGRELDAGEQGRLHVHVALHALATLAWAHEHRDPTWLAAGERALAVALTT